MCTHMHTVCFVDSLRCLNLFKLSEVIFLWSPKETSRFSLVLVAHLYNVFIRSSKTCEIRVCLCFCLGLLTLVTHKMDRNEDWGWVLDYIVP